jgi:hypothetical protein
MAALPIPRLRSSESGVLGSHCLDLGMTGPVGMMGTHKWIIIVLTLVSMGLPHMSSHHLPMETYIIYLHPWKITIFNR